MNKRSANKRKSQPQLKPVYAAVLLAFAIESAQANPIDATVVAGQASFANTGNTLTVVNTPGTIINWQSFSIGSSEITNFVQQSASSAVLNRVIGNDPSNILGTLQSNGRVFLINPHGIVFGTGSSVNVAGLVASTLNLSDADFQAGRYNFTAVPGAQNISNAGNITAQDSGQIYLIAPNVENSGVITAPNGEIYLAAGSSVELVNSNDPNLRVSITAPAGDATNVGQLIASSGSLGLFGTVVRNSGTVSADSATMQGGRIVFRASERVEAGGTISASGAGGGEIKALSDMQNGTVNVTGTLDASAPVSGDGGYIDTSAAHVQIADTASITTAAASGNSGNWLIDPTDFYVSAVNPLNGSSWMSNTVLSSSLLAGNVTIQTLATGVSNGDIFVNGVVSWSANKLTLSAHNNINISANLNGSGTAQLALAYGQGTSTGGMSGYFLKSGVRVNLAAGNNFSTRMGSLGAIQTYYVITSLGNSGSVTGTDLQGINGNLAGNYVLGANINASATSTWNAGAGFASLGSLAAGYSGKFDGLGHSVNNLTINSGADNTGMFGVIDALGSVANVGLLGGTVTGLANTGGLAGMNNGFIFNSYVSNVAVSGTTSVGGLVGLNQGGDGGAGVGAGILAVPGSAGSKAAIAGSYVIGGSVTGTDQVGGLVGMNRGGVGGAGAWGSSISTGAAGGAGGAATISSSYATGGMVNGNNVIGGLVGYNASGAKGADGTGGAPGLGGTGGAGQVTNSYVSAGSITGNVYVGGLVGVNFTPLNSSVSTITDSFVDGLNISGWQNVAGLAGNNSGAVVGSHVRNSMITGTHLVAGLVGTNFGSIASSFVSAATVTSTGTGVSWGFAGGLVGENTGGSIANSYVGAVAVSGNTRVGGLVGSSDINSVVSNSYVMNSSVTAADLAGGLIGSNAGNVINSYVDSSNVSLSVAGNASGGVGGLIGSNSGIVSNSYVSGGTVDGNGATFLIPNVYWGVGGLVGLNSGSITTSYAANTVTNTNSLTTTPMPYSALVGFNNSGGTVTNSFWDVTMAGAAAGVAGMTATTSAIVNVNGLTTAQTMTSGSVSANGFDMVNTWYLIEGNTRPFLQSEWNTTIVNSHQLQLMTMNLGAIYTMGANIDLADTATGTGMWGSGGFVPVGAYPYWPINGIAFTGQLDGMGYTINNLTINRPATSYAGLFGALGWGSVVSNVGLVGGNITGWTHVGALAAYNYGSISNSYVSGMNISACVSCSNIGGMVGLNDGLISNSYVSGGTIAGGWYVGGLVGHNSSGTISSSHVFGGVGSSITGTGAVGGLVGWNQGAINGSHVSSGNVSGNISVGGLAGKSSSFGSISNSYVDAGTVVNGGNYVGGLVGWDSGEGVITGNTVTGATVNGANDVGGLVGWMGSTLWVPGYIDNNHVINSFVSGGTVTGGWDVGGLVGWNGGSISNSTVSGGSVTGNWEVGGLVGYNAPYVSNGSFSSSPTFQGGFIGNSYVATGTVVGSSDVGGLVGLNDGKVSNAYYNVNGVSINGAYRVTPYGLYNNVLNINGVGQFNDWLDGGLLTPLNIADYAMLSGSAGSYTINSVQGMKALLGFADNAAYTFSLASNIDLATLLGYYIPYLAADFNGANFTVSNLNINLNNENQGLFGHIASGSTVSNVNLLNAAASGRLNVGALAGWNEGIISNSSVTNGAINSSVIGLVNVGGLVGWNAGSISNSFVDGSVVTAATGDVVGGLVGWNTATVDASYVAGSQVTGLVWVGGLVGMNSAGAGGAAGSLSAGVVGSAASISNSFVSGGTVIGDSYVGGLVGQNLGGNGGMGGYVYGTGQIGLAGGAGGLAAISNSYVSGGMVSGNINVGGVIGQNLSGNGGTGGDTYFGTGGAGGAGGAATLSNSYVSGVTISGVLSSVGGLVGDNAIGVAGLSGTVWATGGIAGAGGAAGVSEISNSFWNTDTSGSLLAAGINTGTLTNVIGLTTAQMMNMASFTGWSIANTGGAGMTWRIYEGYTGPLLTSFLTQLTVTANDVTKIYDGSAFSGAVGVTYSVAGAGTSVFGTPLGTSGGVNVGSYALNTSGLYSSQQGYDISYAAGTLTVNPYAVSMTSSRVYDGTTNVAAGLFTFGPLVGTETLTLSGIGNASSQNVGTQTVAQGTLALGNGTGLASNYTFTGGTQSVTITPASLTVTASDATKIYGDAGAYLGTEFTSAGLVNGEIIGSVTLSSAGDAANANVAGSPYAITANAATGGTFTASNYSITYVDGQLSVTPALLTIVADDLNKILTTADPLLTYTVYGLKLTDTAAATVLGGLIRDPGEAVGTYQIDMDASNPFVVLNSNYALNSPTYFTPGTFTILAPTVINEIVNISVQGTTSSDEEEKKDSPDTLALLETQTMSSDPEVQSLPVCQ